MCNGSLLLVLFLSLHWNFRSKRLLSNFVLDITLYDWSFKYEWATLRAGCARQLRALACWYQQRIDSLHNFLRTIYLLMIQSLMHQHHGSIPTIPLFGYIISITKIAQELVTGPTTLRYADRNLPYIASFLVDRVFVFHSNRCRKCREICSSGLNVSDFWEHAYRRTSYFSSSPLPLRPTVRSTAYSVGSPERHIRQYFPKWWENCSKLLQYRVFLEQVSHAGWILYCLCRFCWWLSCGC